MFSQRVNKDHVISAPYLMQRTSGIALKRWPYHGVSVESVMFGQVKRSSYGVRAYLTLIEAGALALRVSPPSDCDFHYAICLTSPYSKISGSAPSRQLLYLGNCIFVQYTFLGGKIVSRYLIICADSGGIKVELFADVCNKLEI